MSLLLGIIVLAAVPNPALNIATKTDTNRVISYNQSQFNFTATASLMLCYALVAFIEYVNYLEKKNYSKGLCLFLRIFILAVFVAAAWVPFPFLYLATDHGGEKYGLNPDFWHLLTDPAISHVNLAIFIFYFPALYLLVLFQIPIGILMCCYYYCKHH